MLHLTVRFTSGQSEFLLNGPLSTTKIRLVLGQPWRVVSEVEGVVIVRCGCFHIGNDL